MKIITITKQDKNIVSNRINLDFINRLKDFYDYKCIPVFNRKTKRIILSPENLKKHNPDIIICHTHNKLLDGYLSDFNCLKIMVAVDTYKLKDYSFYEKNKFDLIVHRHYISEDEKRKLPTTSIWLPYSADHNVFKFKNINKKKNRIVFVGTYKPKAYIQRKKAIKILEKHNLIENHGRVLNDNYVNIVSKNRALLNSSEFNRSFVNGKIFEAISCGSIVLTNKFNGMEKLFDKDCFCIWDNNLNDIKEKAEYILKNENECQKMAKKSYDIFINKHTHEKRIKEFSDIINNIYNGKETKNNGYI